MVKKFLTAVYLVFCVLFIYYLAVPINSFPVPPSDSLQSDEPADTETPLRRAYFTNYTRQEIMDHYSQAFGGGLRLNYPPEESSTIIRDQTRSTYLEEIVHPFKESIYINGFEPKSAKDAIIIKELPFRQKVIVRHVESRPAVRIAVGVLTLAAGFLVLSGVFDFAGEAVRIFKRK